jgi:hypothetical protein
MPMTRRLKEARVNSTFDIFKVVAEGPLWIMDVRGLREAKERMVHLVLTSPGEYFIYSQEEGVVARQSHEWADGI